MNGRFLLIGILAILAVLLAVASKRRSNSGGSSGSLETHHKESMKGGRAEPEVALPRIHASSLTESRPTDDPTIVYHADHHSSEYDRRVQEHLAIVKFLESPARGTKEFNQIKELAKMGGFGPVEFQIAHNAAWEVNRYSPERMVANGAEINGSPVDSNDPKHMAALDGMAEALRSAEAAALEEVFGSTNGALINSIFNISPKIPFFDPKKAGTIPSLTEGTILIRIEDLKEW